MLQCSGSWRMIMQISRGIVKAKGMERLRRGEEARPEEAL